ncbi:MAG: glycosyltransferase family 2 protein [Acidimicrobiales bacterium]
MIDGRNVLTSVVIPTYNRSDQLIRLLAALATQVDVDFEVVVADDGSGDDTVVRARALADTVPYPLTVVTSPTNTGPAATRNRGWRRARGDLIAFIDDDCVPAPFWLVNLLSGFDHADLVIGRTRPPDDQLDQIGPFSSYLDIADGEGFLSCNIAYRRSVLEAVDGFDDEAFPLHNGEDTDLGLRALEAGFRDRFVDEALAFHDVHPSDFGAHLRRVRHLEGIVALVARHPVARHRPFRAGWFLRSVDKAVLICWVTVAGLVARPRGRSAWLAAAVGASLYVWQFPRSHYRPRSRGEWATSVPLGFAADSWAVAVMIRSSVRHRTILL